MSAELHQPFRKWILQLDHNSCKLHHYRISSTWGLNWSVIAKISWSIWRERSARDKSQKRTNKETILKQALRLANIAFKPAKYKKKHNDDYHVGYHADDYYLLSLEQTTTMLITRRKLTFVLGKMKEPHESNTGEFEASTCNLRAMHGVIKQWINLEFCAQGNYITSTLMTLR